MESLDLLPPHAYDNDPVDEILVRLDPYIVALVENMARRSSSIARPEVLDLEIDEIVQKVRIKLWKALTEKLIAYPRAYIRAIVSNEFNDIPRKRKAPLPLPTDEDGEIHLGTTLLAEKEGMSDPAYAFELEEGLNEWMALAAQVISHLIPRQKHAMICLLKERIDNRIQLIEAFERHEVNIDDFAWPDNEADEIRLKASIYAARRNIAQRIGILVAEYQQQGIPEATLQYETSPPAQRKESQSMNQKTRESRPSGGPEECAEGVKALAEIADHIAQLHDPYRRAVQLHCVEKRTYSEIARELNLPEGTVKSHVSRGMKLLRGCIEKQHAQDLLHGKPGRDAECNQENAEVVGRIGWLCEPYQRAVQLHCVEKRTYPEIARELNVPEGTVKSQVSRGLRLLHSFSH